MCHDKYTNGALLLTEDKKREPPSESIQEQNRMFSSFSCTQGRVSPLAPKGPLTLNEELLFKEVALATGPATEED